MIEAIKNIVTFIFFVGLMMGAFAGVYAKGCWDNTERSAQRNIAAFYADGGMHDQIIHASDIPYPTRDSGVSSARRRNAVVRNRHRLAGN